MLPKTKICGKRWWAFATWLFQYCPKASKWFKISGSRVWIPATLELGLTACEGRGGLDRLLHCGLHPHQKNLLKRILAKPVLFCLFSSFSQNNDKYSTKFHCESVPKWCCWALNWGPQDGKRRRIHWAMATFPFSKIMWRHIFLWFLQVPFVFKWPILKFN